MISIVITTKKESQTLPKAIEVILEQIQNDPNFELLVVGPDQETEEITKKYPAVKYLKDEDKGKPAALNLTFQKTRGEILILTDGDVYLEKNAIKNLLKYFQRDSELCRSQGCYSKIGAVTGCPVPTNSRKNIFGYWAHFLTNAADWTRRRKSKRNEYITCSGYLYAFRNIVKEVPVDTLVEDGIVSQMVWQNSYKIAYAPEAKVYVKFPTNIQDWFRQKIRSTGGYIQKVDARHKQLIMKHDRMRGFREEVSSGFRLFFNYPKNLKEFFWTILLYSVRLYLWLLIFWKIKILKKRPWERVESTK